MPHANVDWKHAPKTAHWWAMDGNGMAFWYCTPNVAPFTNFWHASQEKAPTFDFDGDYRESLTERPSKA